MASERTTRQINRFLDEAEEAMNNSDWSKVRDRAQNVLRLDPSNADAQAFLAGAEREPQDPAAPTPSTAGPTTTTTTTTTPTEPTLPTSFANGRYQVQRFLDRDVAFALIKTEGLDEGVTHPCPA